MSDDATDPTRTVNEEALRALARTLGGLRTVATASLFPATKQESLVVSVREQFLPADIGDARLEIRSYANGDFHVTYAERYLGELRQCRWDRHDQPHSTRDHYHPLPDASTDEAVDRSYPSTIDEVLRTVVLPWVDDRIGQLWDEA